MLLDKFEPIDKESMLAMFELANPKKSKNLIELGSGNGQFLIEAKKRGIDALGYEIDKKFYDESIKQGLNVINEDCFGADVSDADVVTCWFTKLPETKLLMDKLYKEMKKGARLVKAGKTEHQWKPRKAEMVNRNWICLYIK